MDGGRSKIFGIGLPKTGTTTLAKCLRVFGFSTAPYSVDLLEQVLAADFSGLAEVSGRFDAFEDWPWPLVYVEMHQRFPDARFILTLRSNANAWLDSLRSHTRRNPARRSAELRRKIFGQEDPWQFPQQYTRFYEQHTERVQSYFQRSGGKLLIACWESGDSWKELAEFLSLAAVPAVPFPHENASREALQRQPAAWKRLRAWSDRWKRRGVKPNRK